MAKSNKKNNPKHLSVVTSETPASATRVFKKNNPKVILGVVLAIFTVLIAVIVVNNEDDVHINTDDYNKTCTVDEEILLAEATGYIDSSNYESLRNVTDKIKTKEGFEKDQNCLAVLTFEALSLRDIDAVESYIELIRPVYDQSADKDAGYLFTSNPNKLAELADRTKSAIQMNKDSIEKFNESNLVDDETQ